jgi:hypothetical protein
MGLYRITADRFEALPPTGFSEMEIRERADLQRLLRNQIEIIDPDLLVLSEEVCEWENSRRRIDLLAIDAQANLVVIELKRSGDGGHMELQALRYAAMVAPMTFEHVERLFGSYLRRQNDNRDARTTLLEFLGWEEPDEQTFAQDVRIVLVAADFSRELTTSVLWHHGVDIRCVRLRPHRDGDQVVIDVQQVIPLPEAEEYQVQMCHSEKSCARRHFRKTTIDVLFGAQMEHLCGTPVDPTNPQGRIRIPLNELAEPPKTRGGLRARRMDASGNSKGSMSDSKPTDRMRSHHD